jgi:type III restriction enzyme
MNTFTPKIHQSQVLDSVAAYFKACHELPSPSIAFAAAANCMGGRAAREGISFKQTPCALEV